jgi:hypothetical protein
MRTFLYLVGLCVVLLVVANSQGASVHLCLGKQNGCLVLGSAGIHLVTNDEAKKLNDSVP